MFVLLFINYLLYLLLLVIIIITLIYIHCNFIYCIVFISFFVLKSNGIRCAYYVLRVKCIKILYKTIILY